MSEPIPAVEATKKRKRTGKQREEAKKAAIQVSSFLLVGNRELMIIGKVGC